MGWADDIAGALDDRRQSSVSPPKFSASNIESAISSTEPDVRASRWVPDSPAEQPKYTSPSAFENYIGGPIEALLSFGAKTIAAPVGTAAGLYKAVTGGKYGTAQGAEEAKQRADEVADKVASLIYQPKGYRSDLVDAAGKVLDESKIAGLGPNEVQMLQGVSTPKPLFAFADDTPSASPGSARAPFASVGASGADRLTQARAMAEKASPELRQAVEKAGDKVNLEALERHVDAETLPVPVKLSKGQATQDPVIISNEQNIRGRHEKVAYGFNDQNKALVQNLDAIRDQAAPDVYSTTKPEHGDTIIRAYRSKDAALRADISAKYEALEKANGGKMPLDGVAFADSADQMLHQQLKYDYLPVELRKTIDRLRDGGKMNFEQFEYLRSNIAATLRSNVDGNVKAAAGIVRDALEQMPMPEGAAQLKPLADAARSAAKSRFAMLESDPAYKAVVNGKASADRFIDRYVFGADLKDVQTMKQNLAHDPVAQQTLAAGAMQQLKEAAVRSGNFSQAQYNNFIQKMGPKLGVIFEPEDKAQVEKLGRVGLNVQARPAGSFVNTSNSTTSLLAEAKEGAKGAAEQMANVATKGFPSGTIVRKIGSKVGQMREAKQVFEPGAGIRISEIGK